MATADTAPDPGDLHLKARRVLTAIADAGGTASTSEIRDREYVTFSNQVVAYHTDTLIETGLVERAGSAPAEGHMDPNRYRITDTGEQLAAVIEDPMTRAELERQVRALQERVEQVESETSRIDDRIDRLRDTLISHLRDAGLIG